MALGTKQKLATAGAAAAFIAGIFSLVFSTTVTEDSTPNATNTSSNTALKAQIPVHSKTRSDKQYTVPPLYNDFTAKADGTKVHIEKNIHQINAIDSLPPLPSSFFPSQKNTPNP